MHVAALAHGAERLGHLAVIALGISIPVSVALDNLLLLVVLASYAASGDWRAKLEVIRASPVALAALALFALLALGTLYGDRNPGDAPHFLTKYLDLLFIPLFLALFRDGVTRERALRAFAATLAVIVVVSFAIKLGGLPQNKWIPGHTGNPVVFKEYLTHGILVALGALVFAQLALGAASRRARLVWSGFAALAVLDITLLIPGRTGYVVLIALALYLGFAWAGWRALGSVSIALVAVIGILAVTPGPFQQRLAQAKTEFEQWQPGKADRSSIGQRLEFYRVSLDIVREHPLLGVGTGGFPKAFANKTSGSGVTQTRNPHNEYLLIAVQTGLVGLALLLHLFWRQWRLAPQLSSPLECHIARGLVLTIAIGCLFNSLLLDHTEGLLYAWLTGLLYGGLKSQPPQSGDRAQ